MSKCFNWTPERTDKLKKLWEDGLSASEIAGAFFGDADRHEPSPTRNAIIGKAGRLNLPLRKTTDNGLWKQRKPDTRAKKPRKATARPIRRPRPKPVRLPPPDPPKPYDGPSVSIMDVTEFQCRYVVSGEGVDTRFCGAPIDPDSRLKFCEACKVNRNLIDTSATRRSQHNYTIKRAVAA